MDKEKRKSELDKSKVIHDEMKVSRKNAKVVLKEAKKQEQQKLNTHSWITLPDGKTKILKKNQI